MGEEKRRKKAVARVVAGGCIAAGSFAGLVVGEALAAKEVGYGSGTNWSAFSGAGLRCAQNRGYIYAGAAGKPMGEAGIRRRQNFNGPTGGSCTFGGGWNFDAVHAYGVRGEIYSNAGHPSYFSLVCATAGNGLGPAGYTMNTTTSASENNIAFGTCGTASGDYLTRVRATMKDPNSSTYAYNHHDTVAEYYLIK